MPNDPTQVLEADYIAYDQALWIDKHDLDSELIRQPELNNKVAERAAWAASLAVEAKDALKVKEAELVGRVRTEADEKGERLTEAVAKARVDVHPERIAAAKKYHQATYVADKWQGLKESWASRQYSVRELGELWKAGYYSSKTVREGENGRKPSYAEADRNRLLLNQARRQTENREDESPIRLRE